MQIKNLSFKRIEAGDFTELDNMSREELYQVIRRFNADRLRRIKDTTWRNRGMRKVFQLHPHAHAEWLDYCYKRWPMPEK